MFNIFRFFNTKMSRQKRSHKLTSKLFIQKSKKVKPNKKKSNYCNENSKNTNNLNPKKSSNEKITAQKLKVTCKRYEEFHDNFLSYDKIISFLQKIQKQSPGVVNVVIIGHSRQGKPIYMVQIASVSGTEVPKHVTFIEAGLNGENAIAVSNCLYMIDYLSKNANCIRIMDYFICPCGNPDAYDKFINTKLEKDNPCDIKKSLNKSDNKESKKKCPTTMSDHIAKINNNNKRKCKEDPNKSSTNKKSSNNVTKGSKSSPGDEDYCDSRPKQQEDLFRMDLSNNFPVVLGLNDMRKISTPDFIEKIKYWKESYIQGAPEIFSLLKAINHYQFAIKLLISLHEGGESICYPYAFCASCNQESMELREVAKKGKSAIHCRNFEFGTFYDIRGLTYGTLIDFLKVDKGSIKYMYAMQVHKMSSKYDEKQELKNLMYYGCQTMECIKRMACCVFKLYTNMTGNKTVEIVNTKPGIEHRSSF